MDLRSVAVVILDHENKIIFSNIVAQDLCAGNPGLRSEDGKWTGLIPDDDGVVEFKPSDLADQIRVCRTYLTNGRPNVGYVGLFLQRPGDSREERRTRLQQRFQFTVAELRLVEVLLDGKRPDLAAEELGVTIHTVRTYLKRLYRKLGVHSQATLVCALSKGLD